jgi:hypothetical protein
MTDVLLILVVVAFFVLASLAVRGCRAIVDDGNPESESR